MPLKTVLEMNPSVPSPKMFLMVNERLRYYARFFTVLVKSFKRDSLIWAMAVFLHSASECVIID